MIQTGISTAGKEELKDLKEDSLKDFKEEMLKLIEIQRNETQKELRETKNQYIQIFGVFASIITLVGFNAGSKDITTIIVGNFFLGFFLIGFVWLLYIVPNNLPDSNSILRFCRPKIYFLTKYFISIIIILLFLICGISLDKSTNFGLCKIYPLGEIKIFDYIICPNKS
jgi:hypothetical protein